MVVLFTTGAFHKLLETSKTLPAISQKDAQKLLFVTKAAQKLFQKQTKRVFRCSLPLFGLMQNKSKIFKQFWVAYPGLLHSFVLSSIQKKYE